MTPQERVQQALAELGLVSEVVTFDASTRTASEAAAAVGCELGQIVKSLFFVAEGRPTLVLVAGDRQADTARIAELLGVSRKRLKMGSPEEVLELTGFAVGGVAPVGTVTPCDIVVDDSLQRFEKVWAAAGAGNAVFAAGPGALVEKVGGQWAAITR
ncbi:MAG: YbaK/EbsC family protein [Dehalococcoidia bacterium]